jgi:hypothetical protein
MVSGWLVAVLLHCDPVIVLKAGRLPGSLRDDFACRQAQTRELAEACGSLSDTSDVMLSRTLPQDTSFDRDLRSKQPHLHPFDTIISSRRRDLETAVIISCVCLIKKRQPEKTTRVEVSIIDWWNYRYSPSQRIRYTTSLIIATAHELLLLEASAENAVKPA